MHIEVRFPNGRRMWPAHPERGTRRDAAAPFYELIPVEDPDWTFSVNNRGEWRALRTSDAQ